MGAICAVGHDVPTISAALKSGTVGIGPITNIPTERLSTRVAAEIHGLKIEDHFATKQLSLLDRTSQLALVAARQAMSQAGLKRGQVDAAAVVLGAAIGQQTFDSSYDQLYGQRLPRVHPFTVPRIMPNAPASHVSIEFGVKGPCYAVASACASSNHAIGQAAHMVRAGIVDIAITGGSDASIVVGFMKGWEALRVLSPGSCRPFSNDRDGLVIGEGAGIFVIEEAEHARARDAVPLVEIAGFGMSADGHDIVAPCAEGASRAMSAALADANCTPDQVGYINAHGTGTRLNDRTEVTALHRIFGRALDGIPVSSTKSMIGHCMTAGGALELIATATALLDGILPPTAGFTSADPECDIDCIPNLARAGQVEVAMSNAFAFGGLNAVLVARRI